FLATQPETLSEFNAPVAAALDLLAEVTAWVQEAATTNPDETGAASVPYLRLFTLVLYGYMWGRMVAVANEALQQAGADAAFYDAKLKTARFFVARVLPQ